MNNFVTWRRSVSCCSNEDEAVSHELLGTGYNVENPGSHSGCFCSYILVHLMTLASGWVW